MRSETIIEGLVEESYLVSRCVLYGGGDGLNVARITVDASATANMCSEQIYALVEQAVVHANAQVSASDQIEGWTIIDQDLSPELDEVMPKLSHPSQ